MEKEKSFEQLMLLLAVCSVILLFFLPAIFIGELPEKIPNHFNGLGEPDSYNDKNSIWVLPIIGLVFFFMMEGIARFLQKWKAKPKHGQTEKEAEELKWISIEMLRTLNGVILAFFAYIVWSTIQIGLGNQKGLGSSFTMLFMVATFAFTGYYIYKMTMVKK
jgi:uncharacterized membrane protein